MLREWLTPPQHDDPEEQLRARVLHWVLVGAVGVLSVSVLSLPLYETDPYTLPTFGASLLLGIVGLVMLRRGHTQAAAVMVCVFAWLFVILVSIMAGGIRSPQLATIVVVVMLAGFVLGTGAAFATAALTSLSVLAIIVLGDRGLLPSGGPRPSMTTEWAAITMVLVIAAIFLHQALRAIDESRADAAEKSRRLLEEVERSAAAEESLRRGQKLEALGRLTGGIAHDFNNILTVLMAQGMFLAEHAERAGKAGGFGDEARLQVGEIQASVERAAMLTRRLLGFATPGAGRPRPVDVGAALLRLTPVLRRVLPETIRLRVAPVEERLVVQIDTAQLEQVLLNLVLNARDALPSGGELGLRAFSSPAGAAFAARHPGASPGNHVGIAVSDDGAGIDAADQERIFDPFYTTKALGHGTGLGLATVHGIVTQAGGQLEVESEPGRGTTFTLYLPAAPEGVVPVDPTPPSRGAGGPPAAGTILVCEDEAPVRAVIESVLAGAGYTVLSAPSPERALEIARANDASLDLLVSDVVMPGMSGTDLAERLRAEHPQLPVLLVTGYAPEQVGETSAETDLLEKPFTPPALLARVRALLAAARGASD